MMSYSRESKLNQPRLPSVSWHQRCVAQVAPHFGRETASQSLQEPVVGVIV